jgi:hypothetical protein
MAWSPWLPVAVHGAAIRSPEQPLAAGTRTVEARIAAGSDWANPPLRALDVAVEVSFDGRATWRPWMSVHMDTSTRMRDGSLPQLASTVPATAETWIRAVVTPSAPFSFGVDGQVT